MPFCTQCGTEVTAVDRFCARCGKAQAAPGQAAPGMGPGTAARDPLGQLRALDSRTSSLLCYIPVVGWIMSIVVLASAKYRDDLDTRFHAFQGLYLFVGWLIASWVLSPMTSGLSHVIQVGGLLKAVIIGASIFMLVKVSQRERFKLPFIGDLAEKSVSEQRV